MEVNVQNLRRVGRFQWLLLALASIITAPGNFANIGILFFAPDLDFSCRIPEFQNLTRNEASIAMRTWPECQRPKYIPESVQYDSDTSSNQGTNFYSTSNNTEWVKCDRFKYDHTLFTWSATERFNLVCDRSWLGPFLSTIFMAGYFLGGIVSGTIADKFGRRWSLLLGLVLMIASDLMGALAPNIEVFVLARFLVAISDTTVYNAAYVIAMEVLRKEERILAICLVTLCWVMSACAMAGISSLLPNYEHMFYFLAALTAMILVVSWFCVPESSRWLSSKGRTKEVDDAIERISRFNNQNVSELTHLRRGDEKEVDISPLLLLKTPVMRKRTIVQWFLWLSTVLVNYGVLYNLGDFGNNIRQSTVISSLMELPGWIIVVIMMDKIGRQMSQFTMGLMAGLCFLATAPIVEQKGSMALLLLALLGKVCAANQLTICFTHTPELYPTQCRSLGLGTASTIGRVAGMVAPQLKIFRKMWAPALPVILGVVCFFTSLIVPILPDTTSHELAQTLDDGESFLPGHRYKLVLPPNFSCCGKDRHVKSDQNTTETGTANGEERVPMNGDGASYLLN